MKAGNNSNNNSNYISSKKGKLTTLWQPLLLLMLIILGTILHFAGVLDWQKVLHWAQSYAQYWWVPVVLIMLQVLLFTFALPGSAVLWVVAPIYEPEAATTILATGSTLGALSAYLFARHETLAWMNHVQNSHLFQVLEHRGDFLSICALRLIPAFPHSVINYGAGMLRLPILQFLAASLIGLAIKSFLYCNTIHGAITATDLSELVRLKTLGPLVILAILTTAAALLRSRWSRIHRK